MRARVANRNPESSYEAMGAENGHEALKLFDAENFKAVFTDVGMPNGGWNLRAIRERDSDVPLAVITGWGDVSQRAGDGQSIG